MQSIVGPVPSDLDLIGLNSDKVILSTAFYSSGVLDNLNVGAKKLSIFVRLDLSSIDTWAAGMIDPPALLRFYERNSQSCAEIQIWGSPIAHAKIYAGEEAYLIGSANLTQKGFAGLGHEILWLEKDRSRGKTIFKSLQEYQKYLTQITFPQLKEYVAKNQAKAEKLAEKIRKPETDENRALKIQSSRPDRLGDYDDFLAWLSKQPDSAAREIYARATWKGQLSGHIHRNFYGLRQFLLAHPMFILKFSKIDPSRYSLARDTNTSKAIQNFVLNHATGEQNFSVDTWRTYLPMRCGGKPKSGGGTSGNLNRMIPLISSYLLPKLKI